jgi:hypothetical protein
VSRVECAISLYSGRWAPKNDLPWESRVWDALRDAVGEADIKEVLFQEAPRDSSRRAVLVYVTVERWCQCEQSLAAYVKDALLAHLRPARASQVSVEPTAVFAGLEDFEDDGQDNGYFLNFKEWWEA